MNIKGILFQICCSLWLKQMICERQIVFLVFIQISKADAICPALWKEGTNCVLVSLTLSSRQKAHQREGFWGLDPGTSCRKNGREQSLASLAAQKALACQAWHFQIFFSCFCMRVCTRVITLLPLIFALREEQTFAKCLSSVYDGEGVRGYSHHGMCWIEDR